MRQGCARYPPVNLRRVIFRGGDRIVMPVVVIYFLPVELAALLGAALFWLILQCETGRLTALATGVGWRS